MALFYRKEPSLANWQDMQIHKYCYRKCMSADFFFWLLHLIYGKVFIDLSSSFIANECFIELQIDCFLFCAQLFSSNFTKVYFGLNNLISESSSSNPSQNFEKFLKFRTSFVCFICCFQQCKNKIWNSCLYQVYLSQK